MPKPLFASPVVHACLQAGSPTEPALRPALPPRVILLRKLIHPNSTQNRQQPSRRNVVASRPVPTPRHFLSKTPIYRFVPRSGARGSRRPFLAIRHCKTREKIACLHASHLFFLPLPRGPDEPRVPWSAPSRTTSARHLFRCQTTSQTGHFTRANITCLHAGHLLVRLENSPPSTHNSPLGTLGTLPPRRV